MCSFAKVRQSSHFKTQRLVANFCLKQTGPGNFILHSHKDFIYLFDKGRLSHSWAPFISRFALIDYHFTLKDNKTARHWQICLLNNHCLNITLKMLELKTHHWVKAILN